MSSNKNYIYGKHALVEALGNAPETIDQIFTTSSFEDEELKSLFKKNSISPIKLPYGKLPPGFELRDDKTSVPQGVVASISLDKLIKPYKGFIENLEINEDTSLVILGEIQDPQNVGAVIRSAAAFGISGVLIPEHNQAPITGVVVKVSAGMAFRVPLVSIGNVNSVIRDLKEKGFWIYGLDGSAKHNVTKESFDRASVFILGNEAEGIRVKTLELCDEVLSIPMNAKCESLNASVSAAVTMYAWSAQHPKALKNNK